MTPLAEWMATGQHIRFTRPRGAGRGPLVFEIFCRSEGSGPWLTLLHGFPTCSWDWAKVAPLLTPHFRLLAFDFLGFGDSDKPEGHAYSLFEQADLTEELWRQFGVRESALLVHDYGVSVSQELLARRRFGSTAPTAPPGGTPAAKEESFTAITGVVFLNGGLYPDLHRPILIQRLLAQPLLGPLLARAMTERAFRQSFRSIFSPAHQPSDDELRQHWQAIERKNGRRVYHRLMGYMAERHRTASRWVSALEQAAMPLSFVWGMCDPISGAHVAERLRDRLPAATRVELTDVGHYPQLEVPETVAREVVRAFEIETAPTRRG